MLKRLLKYRKLLILITYFYVKHSIIRFVYRRKSSKLLDYYISRSNYNVSTNQDMQPIRSLLGQTDRILQILDPGVNCLVESMVKKEVLAKHGYNVKVNLSVYRSDEAFKAHAWLLVPKMNDYKTLLKI